MSLHNNKITTCLWFDSQAEEAVKLYTSIFPNSEIKSTLRYPAAGKEVHGQEPGSVMNISFSLSGHSFVALNGGPHFTFSPATSFQIDCKDQAEVDYYWEKLTPGGDKSMQRCGWVKDKFGVSWQVIPAAFLKMQKEGDKASVERLMEAMMKMQKLDVGELERAFRGE